MARPKIELDGEQIFKLAQLGCKNEEMANFFGCSVDTLTRRFADEITKGKADLRISLRRMQIDAARNGNATLLVWLGKQMLGQSDQPQPDENIERPLKDLTDEELNDL